MKDPSCREDDNNDEEEGSKDSYEADGLSPSEEDGVQRTPKEEPSELDRIVKLLQEYRIHSALEDGSIAAERENQAGLHTASNPISLSNSDAKDLVATASQTMECSTSKASQSLTHHKPKTTETEASASNPPGGDHGASSIAEASHDNRRASRREQLHNVSTSGPAFAHTRSMYDHALPHLDDPDWLVPIESKKGHCRDWKRAHRCKRPTCFFIHKHGPWGECLDSLWSEMGMCAPPEFAKYAPEFESCARTKCEVVGTTKWWTAGYISRTRFNLPMQVYYAEGGPARISSQGVSWYSTQEEAYAALRKVAMVSAWAAERRRTPASSGLPSPEGGFRSSSLALPRSNVNFKRHSDFSSSAGSGAHRNGCDRQVLEDSYSGLNHHHDQRGPAERENQAGLHTASNPIPLSNSDVKDLVATASQTMECSTSKASQSLTHHKPKTTETEASASSAPAGDHGASSIAEAPHDNRRASRREQLHNVSTSGPAFAHTRSMYDHALPHLDDPDWLVPIESKIGHCRDWKRAHRCKRPTCFFIHKHGPWGECLDSLWSEMGMCAPPEFGKYAPGFESCACTKCEVVGTTKWWTAGYISRTRFNLPMQVYYAEGGPARISSQGVSWYSTQEEAYAALKKVAMVSAWAAERRRTPASEAGFRSSSTALPRSNTNFKRHSDFSFSAGYGAHRNGSDRQVLEDSYSGLNHHHDQREPKHSSHSDEHRPARSSHFDQQRPVSSGDYGPIRPVQVCRL